MSAIQGTYKNDNINATLVISQANDANGQITAGTLAYGGCTYQITGHYHFKNSTGPTTVIYVCGGDPTIGVVSFSLAAGDMSFKVLKSFGGFVDYNNNAIGLGGAFLKQ